MRLYLTLNAYEFACKSAACAPPNKKGTGGTGGSLKENDGRNSRRAPHSAGQTGPPKRFGPPKGLPAPSAKSTNRKLAPHSKGQGKKLILFPAPTGKNRTKEHDKYINDEAEKKRHDAYVASRKQQDEFLKKQGEGIRAKNEAKREAERAAEEAEINEEANESAAKRAARSAARRAAKAESAKRAEDIVKKHREDRAAGRTKK